MAKIVIYTYDIAGYLRMKFTFFASNEIPYFAVSTLLIFFLISIVYRFFGIYYETNDDVGMMMIAHGFGISAHPMPTLLFSNAIQGHVINFLSWPFHRAGYSVYLFVCLIFSSSVIISKLTSINNSFSLNVFAVCVMCIRPIFAPQFTIIASFLAIAAVVSLLAYMKLDRTVDLVIAAIMAFLAFLMRDQSLYFISLIALPACVTPGLLRDVKAIAVGAGLLAAMGASYLYDSSFYQTEAWLPYTQLNKLRAVFTDYNLTQKFLGSEELRTAVGWTSNDVKLLSNWWFLDPKRFTPDKFRLAIEASGVLPTFSFDFARARHWLGQYASFDMLPVLILFVGPVLSIDRRRLAHLLVMGLIYIGVTLGFTFAGRLDVSRVFYPGVCLLVTMALLYRGQTRYWRSLPISLAAIGAATLALMSYIPRAEALEQRRAVFTAGLRKVPPADVHAAWGAHYEYEAAYPALARGETYPKLKIYGIGVGSLAPYGLAHWGGSLSGFYKQFQSDIGISVFSTPRSTGLLKTYCEEKFAGRFKILSMRRVTDKIHHFRLRCTSQQHGSFQARQIYRNWDTKL